MGFRFSIKNANAVGHLIDGNIVTFLKECAKSHEMLQPNFEFIDHLMRGNGDFYTTEVFWSDLSGDFTSLRERWEFARQDFLRLFDLREDEFFNLRELLAFLKSLSDILSRCKVKTLLLPGFTDSSMDSYMTNERMLQDLVHIHPGDSTLILQLKEQIGKDNISILNAFSKFEEAYNNVDLWPGILLWNDNDSLFVKIDHYQEVREVYEILRYEKGSLSYLRRIFSARKKQKSYAYIFHLSDLHFGNDESNRRKLRLTRILETQLSQLNDKSAAIPVITGDLMDSPTNTNKNTYIEFCELIKSKGFSNPIQLLGNHDVDTSGILKLFTRQKSVISSLSNPKNVEVLNELGLAFIKFNSNTGGQLAQGKVGNDQLMNIGNEIDELDNKQKLNFIALIHHHPKEIENPYWYGADWYEAFLGGSNFEKTMRLVDADLFLQWLENRGIHLVLHGHKHIPKIHHHNDITIIAAGSATGKVKHKEDGKTFLSYNLIKYDIDEKRPLSCQIIAEEVLGSGAKNLLLHKL